MGGAISGFVSDRVDHILDDNEDFQAVVLIAFDGALDPESTQRIKYEALLPALIRVYEKLGNSLPRPSRHLVLRRPTEADIAAVMGDDERPERIDFDLFETIARSVFRRVAVDCSKRLFVSIVGGTAAVAVLKQTLRRAPLVGPIFSVLIDPMVPALCVSGPAVGIAAAAHWDHLPRLENKRQRASAAAAAALTDGASTSGAGSAAAGTTAGGPQQAADPSSPVAVRGRTASEGALSGPGSQGELYLGQQQGRLGSAPGAGGAMMHGSGSAGSLSVKVSAPAVGGRGATPHFR